MTKSSDLDRLHTQFTKALAAGLKGETDADGNHVPPSPALLSVVGAFLYRSGTKAVSDSPSHLALARSYESLPFTDTDAPSAPSAYTTTNPKAQH